MVERADPAAIFNQVFCARMIRAARRARGLRAHARFQACLPDCIAPGPDALPGGLDRARRPRHDLAQLAAAGRQADPPDAAASRGIRRLIHGHFVAQTAVTLSRLGARTTVTLQRAAGRRVDQHKANADAPKARSREGAAAPSNTPAASNKDACGNGRRLNDPGYPAANRRRATR